MRSTPPSPNEEETRRDRGDSPAILATVILLLVATTIVWTWPIAARFAQEVPVDADSTETIWKFWWIERAFLVEKTSPYWCDFQLYPQGLSFLYTNPLVLYGVISLPVLAATDGVGVLIALSNFWLLFTYPVGGFAVYLLARRFTRNRAAAWIAGFLYAFMPLRGALLSSVNVASTFWLPLLLLAGLPTGKDVSPVRRGLLAGGAAVGAFLTSLTCLWFIMVSLPLLAAARWIGRPSGWRWTGEIRFWAAAALPPVLCVAAIALLSPAGTMKGAAYYTPPERVSSRLALEPSFFTTRQSDQRIMQVRESARSHPINLAYPGAFTLLWVAAGSCALRWRRGWIFPALALAGFLLSLGPFLDLGGFRPGLRVPLPYWLFQKLGPPFDFFRTPYRYLLLMHTGLAVLAGVGIAGAVRYAGRIRSDMGRRAVLALLSLGALAAIPDLYQGTVATHAPARDEIFLLLREGSTSEGSVLILPASAYIERVEHRMAQVLMDRPIPTSTVTRVAFRKSEPFRRCPYLRNLVNREDPGGTIDASGILRELGEAGIRWIVATINEEKGNPALRRFVQESGLLPSHREGRWAVFEIPPPSDFPPETK
ncbi:MAG: hypothetical protein JW958_04935 [Candidatus Eisenbacteria bacterium]|nr:hypothetical protein [Candidatus Eisenbacteria bacterium]